MRTESRFDKSPTKWNLHKQDKLSHYMSDGAHKVKADIEKKKLWR